jgi:hypothetical protein
MNAPRSSHLSWLPILVVGCVLVAGALGWLAWQERANGYKAQAALRAKVAERDFAIAQSPQPSEATEKTLRDEVAALRQSMRSLATALAGQASASLESAAPANPVDAYFELATFVEKNRALAAAARTSLAENERFGFSLYQTEGPGLEILPAVARQAGVMRHLLECLFESSPHMLLAAQRERPLTSAQRAARRAGGDTRVAPVGSEAATRDYFAIDPALSLFAPGETDTMAFRVEFTGRTSALRGFLNALAAFKLPLFVRSVEVEPLASNQLPSAGPTGTESTAPLPVIAQNVSKFAVVVELVELVRRPTNP